MGKRAIGRPKETWRRMAEKSEMRLGGHHGQRWHRGRPTEAAQRAADRGGTEGGRQRRHRGRPTEAAQRAADRAEWRTLVHAL